MRLSPRRLWQARVRRRTMRQSKRKPLGRREVHRADERYGRQSRPQSDRRQARTSRSIARGSPPVSKMRARGLGRGSSCSFPTIDAFGRLRWSDRDAFVGLRRCFPSRVAPYSTLFRARCASNSKFVRSVRIKYCTNNTANPARHLAIGKRSRRPTRLVAGRSADWNAEGRSHADDRTDRPDFREPIGWPAARG